MKLTPKQRAKIYREAAKRVFENAGNFIGDNVFSCHAIDGILKKRIGYTNPNDWKELALFVSDREFSDPCKDEYWHYSEYQERTLGLLLAEQIALKPIYK